MEHPLHKLSREDLDLVMELVLKSGSIKDLALSYGVSYPTMRTRLDRVIERLEAVRAGKPPDELTLLLAQLVERGEVAPGTARAIREKAREVHTRDAHAAGHTTSGGSQ